MYEQNGQFAGNRKFSVVYFILTDLRSQQGVLIWK
jgi:hypothetical protein